MLFLRAADPDHPHAERHYMQQFFLDGDDIKHLYQVLHEHYCHPRVMKRNTGEWFDDAKKPEPVFVVDRRDDPNKYCTYPVMEKPHEKYKDIELD